MHSFFRRRAPPLSAPHANKKGEALIDAASVGDVALIRALLQSNATLVNYNAMKNLSPSGAVVGGTALIWASRWGHIDAVVELIRLGASLEATDTFGRTAVRHAATTGNVAVLKELLGHGANPSNVDCKSWSALAKALAKGQMQSCAALLASGRVDADDLQRTLNYARAHCSQAAIMMLQKSVVRSIELSHDASTAHMKQQTQPQKPISESFSAAQGSSNSVVGMKIAANSKAPVAQPSIPSSSTSSVSAAKKPRLLLGRGATGCTIWADETTDPATALKLDVPAQEINHLKLIYSSSGIEDVPIVRCFRIEEATHTVALERMHADLQKLVNTPSRRSLPRRLVMRNVLLALSHLHNVCGVAHRDVKPSNILLDEELSVVKLCDFGSSCVMATASTAIPTESLGSVKCGGCAKRDGDHAAKSDGGTSQQLRRAAGTVWYRAPEVLQEIPYSGVKNDIWAAGCILVEMAVRKPAFPGHTKSHTLSLIMKSFGASGVGAAPAGVATGPRDAIAEWQELKYIGRAEREFALLLLAVDPALRPTADEALAHDFFRTSTS